MRVTTGFFGGPEIRDRTPGFKVGQLPGTDKEQFPSLRVISWNLGFGSRKAQFIESDNLRAQKIVEIARALDVDVFAFQEMANRQYVDGSPSFELQQFLQENDPQLRYLHFEKTLSFHTRHSYPYGKLAQLRKKLAVQSQENGLGIGVRDCRHWQLANLYTRSTEYPAIVEAQRPLPHPLYMGENPAPPGLEAQSEFSAGRDEEDRPVLWARLVNCQNTRSTVLFYFVGLHLPTLKGEEKNLPPGELTRTQIDLIKNVLRLPESRLKQLTVDELGSALRLYFLQQLLAQAARLEAYWKTENRSNSCVFILAGDFNFYHSNATVTAKTAEQLFLENNGFIGAKRAGASRPICDHRLRLVDNIWVRGAKRVSEITFSLDSEKVPIESSHYNNVLTRLSDHYPVIADITW